MEGCVETPILQSRKVIRSRGCLLGIICPYKYVLHINIKLIDQKEMQVKKNEEEEEEFQHVLFPLLTWFCYEILTPLGMRKLRKFSHDRWVDPVWIRSVTWPVGLTYIGRYTSRQKRKNASRRAKMQEERRNGPETSRSRLDSHEGGSIN